MKLQTFFFTILCVLYSSDAQTTPRARVNQTSGLVFTSNATSNTLSIANTTAATAGAFQPKANLSSIFNGNNGSAIIYNSQSETGVFIPGNFSNTTWNSSAQNWTNYIQNLNLTHQFIIGRTNGSTFNKFNVSSAVSGEISSALSSWAPQYPPIPDPFATFANTSTSILNLFNGPLNGWLTLIGDRAFIMAYDYFWMNEFFHGLESFYNSINGGIPFLLNRGFFFNPIWAFNARNGIEAYLALLQALRSSSNLPTTLNANLYQPPFLPRMFNQLGGNSCRGVNGQLRAAFESLSSRNASCDPENNESVRKDLNQSVSALNNASRRLGPRFRGLRNFARQLRRNERE